MVMHPVPHIVVRAMTHSRSGGRYYRPRAMSLENPKLLEALTIYEKLKRCQEECDPEIDGEQNNEDSNQPGSFKSQNHCDDHKFTPDEEPLPLDPFTPNFDDSLGLDENRELQAYSKYKDINLHDANYLYFSGETGLLQSKTLEGLSEEEEEMTYKELLLSKKYWLDVVNPTDSDLNLLSSAFRVHELTLRDIKEGHTEEKVEMYNHYTFISLKLMKELSISTTPMKATNADSKTPTDNSKIESLSPPNFKTNRKYSTTSTHSTDEEKEYLNIHVEDEEENCETTTSSSGFSSYPSEPDSTTTITPTCNKFYLPTPADFVESDTDLNILIFSDFIITLHKTPWDSVKDVLGFLSILTDFGGPTPPLPEWVLFSVFVELAQDAKFAVKKVTPTILSMRAAQFRQEDGLGVDVLKLSSILRQNFIYEFDIYKICRFIKPKLQVLRAIQLKGRRRFPNVPGVVRYLANVGAEFDEILDDLDNLSRVVERSQDTFLTLASVQQSVEANEMGDIMKRISEIAMIFLPVQAISGFLGMNVKVPFQEQESTFPFWTVVMGSIFIAASLFIGKRLILHKKRLGETLCPTLAGLKKDIENSNLKKGVGIQNNRFKKFKGM